MCVVCARAYHVTESHFAEHQMAGLLQLDCPLVCLPNGVDLLAPCSLLLSELLQTVALCCQLWPTMNLPPKSEEA